MKWTRINAAVYQTEDEIVSVSRKDLDRLKMAIAETPDKRIRLCAHPNAQDNTHEMMIAIRNDSYIRPHKHLNKSESFHLIEGLIDVIIFDEKGEIQNIIAMGEVASGQHFYYRLSAPYFHTVFIKTEIAIFHETTTGPFVSDQTVYPSWAPEPNAHHEITLYQQQLMMKMAHYHKDALTGKHNNALSMAN